MSSSKSNLHSRYARHKFNLHSNVEFQTHRLEIDSNEVKAQDWDTAGQQRLLVLSTEGLLVLSLFMILAGEPLLIAPDAS